MSESINNLTTSLRILVPAFLVVGLLCWVALQYGPEMTFNYHGSNTFWGPLLFRLVVGGAALDSAVDDVLANYGKGRLIFNLGHGIQPETPIAHVEQMIKRVRAYRG